MASSATRHSGPAEDRIVPPAACVVDLHTHSTRSDGVLDPGELVAAAAAAGIRTLALTDHDTLAGVRELVAGQGVPPGLVLIPGIEINAVILERRGLEESEVHILGLGVDPADERLETALSSQRDHRRTRFERMLARCRDEGLAVEAQLERLPVVGDEDALGRPRLARALVALGHASDVPDAFDRWLSPGRPLYVPRVGLGPIEAIDLIRRSGGLASLAHFPEAPEHLGLIAELVEAGLGGLEVHHRSFGIAAVAAVGAIAHSFGLQPTGGSDFHGDGESYAEAHATLWVPDEVGEHVRIALGLEPDHVDRTPQVSA